MRSLRLKQKLSGTMVLSLLIAFCVACGANLFLAIPASARSSHRVMKPVVIRLIDHSQSLDASTISAIATALQTQLNEYFREYYLVRRPIEVLTGRGPGLHVTIVDHPIYAFGSWDQGYHWFANGRPYAMVTTYKDDLPAVIDHEIMEMLVDPFANGSEICDGLGRYFYFVGGYPMSDFRLPKGGHFCGTVNFCQ